MGALGGDHHGPDVSPPVCRGGRCDDTARCSSAGRCTYKSSAEEAREAQVAEILKGKKIDPWCPDCLDSVCDKCAPPIPVVERPLRNTGPRVAHAEVVAETAVVRTFATGANRDVDTNKLDFEGFISPVVLKCFAEYMHKNRFLRDGSIRDSDNWQKGMPLDVLMKSLLRHVFAVWLDHRLTGHANLEDLNGVFFNVQAYMLQRLRGLEK